MPRPHGNLNTNEDTGAKDWKADDGIWTGKDDGGTRTQTTPTPTQVNIEGQWTELPPGTTFKDASGTWTATAPDGTRYHYLGDGWVTIFPADGEAPITQYWGPPPELPSEPPGDWVVPWWESDDGAGDRYEQQPTPLEQLIDADNDRPDEVPV